MTYTYTHESREAAHRAGRLCCVTCLLDLGDADDPYRDPDCPRCLERELEAEYEADKQREEEEIDRKVQEDPENPLARRCDDCGAEPGESCFPDCLSLTHEPSEGYDE